MLKSPLFGFDEMTCLRSPGTRQGLLRAALRAQGERRDSPQPTRCSTAARDGAQRDALRILRLAARRRTAGAGDFLRGSAPRPTTRSTSFSNLALDYERRETPSLQGFVAWLRAAQAEVKRDMEIERDEVRVMTVHGAKGLEAPIVILADTTTPPAGPPDQPRLLALQARGAPACSASAGRAQGRRVAAGRARARNAAPRRPRTSTAGCSMSR